MPTVKKLQFANGTVIASPIDLNFNKFGSYANDAAFAAENFVEEGSIYLNSTLKAPRIYLGGVWRTGIMQENATNATKTVKFDTDGAVSGADHVLDFNGTADRTYTFPDVTGTVVLTLGAQELQDKIIKNGFLDGTKIRNNALDVEFAGALTVGASVGANNLTLGGANSTVQIPGNLTVSGSTTTVNTTTLDVKDVNITVNKSGSDASSQGAGITVDRVGTKGSIVYDSAATSKFKVGNLASEVEIADISSAQSLTNKTINASLNTVSNISSAMITGAIAPSKGGTGVSNNDAATLTRSGNHAVTLTTTAASNVTLPTTGTLATTADITTTNLQMSNKTLVEPIIDNFAAFNHETTPTSAAAGTMRFYAKNDEKFYQIDTSGTEREIATGYQQKNYLLEWSEGIKSVGTVQTLVGDIVGTSTRLNPSQWGSSDASALISDTNSTLLRGSKNYLVGYTAAGQFVESPLFNIDAVDSGKSLFVRFDVSGVGAVDDVQVYISRYNNSNVLQERIIISGTASASAPNSARVSTGITTFRGSFTSSATSTDKYAIRWQRNGSATSGMRLDSLFVGPQTFVDAQAVSGSFTTINTTGKILTSQSGTVTGELGFASGTGDNNVYGVYASTGKEVAIFANANERMRFTSSAAEVKTNLDFNEISTTTSPDSGKLRIYAKSDGKIYKKDDSGSEKELAEGYFQRNYLQDWYDGTKLVGTVLEGIGGPTNPTANRDIATKDSWYVSDISNIEVGNHTFDPQRPPGDIWVNSKTNIAAASIDSPLFQIDRADNSKSILISLDLLGINGPQNYDIVVVRYNSTGVHQEIIPVISDTEATGLSTLTPASSYLSSGNSVNTIKFRGTFTSSSNKTDYYSLRLRKVAAIDDDFWIDSIYVGPNQEENSLLNNQTCFKNKIINGNFDVWQRDVSQSSSGYGSADRWSFGNVGSTKTVTRQAFTVGQSDVPNNPTYFCRTVVSSVAGSGNYVQNEHKIEGVRNLSGQAITLSFWAKADSAKNIAIEFSQNFGTGGSAAVTGIAVTTCSLTTSWKKFTITTKLPSLNTSPATVIGTNDHLRILFWLDAGSSFNSRTNSLGQQSGTFDISQVQLEQSITASSFELRPLTTELQLCQRYFTKTYALDTAIGTVTSSGSLLSQANTTSYLMQTLNYHPVAMRITPTITFYNPVTGASGSIRNETASTNVAFSNSNAVNATEKSFEINSSATFVAGNIYRAHWVANAEIL